MADGISRIPGTGWLALLGGGEFSFGETVDADRPGWRRRRRGRSGSSRRQRVGRLSPPLRGVHDGSVRARAGDHPHLPLAGRPAGPERRADPRTVPAVYIGGGVTDHLLEALAGDAGRGGAGPEDRGAAGWWWRSPPRPRLPGGWRGASLRGGPIPGFGWLPDGVVEPNFDPGHDRRLRKLLAAAGSRAGAWASRPGRRCCSGPEGPVEVVGTASGSKGRTGHGGP